MDSSRLREPRVLDPNWVGLHVTLLSPKDLGQVRGTTGNTDIDRNMPIHRTHQGTNPLEHPPVNGAVPNACFQERPYSEFVTFLPYVQRFLYGEGKGNSPEIVHASSFRVFRRSDVAGALTRAEFVRLGLAASLGTPDSLPNSERHLRDFEECYCYDRYWDG